MVAELLNDNWSCPLRDGQPASDRASVKRGIGRLTSYLPPEQPIRPALQ